MLVHLWLRLRHLLEGHCIDQDPTWTRAATPYFYYFSVEKNVSYRVTARCSCGKRQSWPVHAYQRPGKMWVRWDYDPKNRAILAVQEDLIRDYAKLYGA